MGKGSNERARKQIETRTKKIEKENERGRKERKANHRIAAVVFYFGL